ncbi:MAG: phospholipase [Flavobacterium sp.]|nr:MAG: phospholipase [Flavobacterium sp.]
MTQRWELDTLATSGTFIITPYKPIYILPVRWTSSPNEKPYSGNNSQDYNFDEDINLNNFETKFQLSFKVKIFQGLLWGYGDVWGAYTQKSHWQLYNASLSRPFREINYEPEIIVNFATNFKFFGFTNRMVGVSFNHQSNGREIPLSRSWNRIIFHTGFDNGPWQVYLRPWIRLSDETDDNPDIQEFLGRGDATVTYTYKKNIMTFNGSSNLSFNRHLKGFGEFSWSYPIKGNLKGNLQVSHGYGETLIDYNNLQTTIGIGISLVEWL